MWGDGSKQEYFEQGRGVKEILRSQINSRCESCNYLTLEGTNDFENHNGGLTVKRSDVRIIDDETEQEVITLRPREDDFFNGWGCNACVNDWR